MDSRRCGKTRSLLFLLSRSVFLKIYSNTLSKSYDTSQVVCIQQHRYLSTIVFLDQCYDYVSIYDVLDSGNKLLKIYCGDKIPAAIQSTNNEMILTLYSDATVAARGFLAFFSAEGLHLYKDCLLIFSTLWQCTGLHKMPLGLRLHADVFHENTKDRFKACNVFGFLNDSPKTFHLLFF